MRMFLLGTLTIYLITGLLLAVFDGRCKSGIELFDGWLTWVICLPILLITRTIDFIWVKVIHYGKKRVHSIEKGTYWVKMK